MVQLELFEQSLRDASYRFDGSAGYNSYMQNSWAQVAETTMPLKASKLAAANQGMFMASIEMRSKRITREVVLVNLISLFVNLALSIIAFYFAFVNNSPSTQAFATDCVLDLISSGIVLWRYYGDVSSIYIQAREQIACIYLGSLFVLSSLAIIIKATSDVISDTSALVADASQTSNELVYLATVATVACSVITVFKCALYRRLRDNSILLDVVNTLISTVFAISIVMSQVLINVDPSFWYLDPVLSVVLALFMMGFGLKVIHQNLDVLKPVYSNSNNNSILISSFRDNGHDSIEEDHLMLPLVNGNNGAKQFLNYGANLNHSAIGATHPTRIQI